MKKLRTPVQLANLATISRSYDQSFINGSDSSSQAVYKGPR